MAGEGQPVKRHDGQTSSRDGTPVTVFNPTAEKLGCVVFGKVLVVPETEAGRPGTLICKRYEADALIAANPALTLSAEKKPEAISVPWSRVDRIQRMTREQLVAIVMLLNRDELPNPGMAARNDIDVLRSAARALITGETTFVTLPAPEPAK